MQRVSLTVAAVLFLAAWGVAQPPPEAKPAAPPAAPGAAPAAPAAPEVELAWKFTKDAVFYQKLKTNTSQTMKIMNQNVDQKQEQEFVFSWKVEDADASKVVLTQKIEAMTVKISIGGSEIKYDSAAKDAADNPLAPFFKPLIGSSFKLTLDPAKNSIVKIDGRDEFVKKLSDANPQMQGLLKAILGDDQLKQMSEPVFGVLPDKGKKVKVGDTWSRSSDLNMGAIGSFAAKYDYKYAGTEKKQVDGKDTELHKIELTTSLTYKAPDGKGAAGLPFTIKGGDLKTDKATGVIYFDLDKGRVVESSTSVDLKGKLSLSVSDQNADVDMEQKQTSTTTSSDKNPLETAK